MARFVMPKLIITAIKASRTITATGKKAREKLNFWYLYLRRYIVFYPELVFWAFYNEYINKLVSL